MTDGIRNDQAITRLLTAAQELRDELKMVAFHSPVAWTYSPLEYAWEPYQAYIRQYGASPKKVIFLGMNPGPWGMAQTGIPFGEIKAVTEWLGIQIPFIAPVHTHPDKPILGFASTRSEISGKRLWGFFRDQFTAAAAFFRNHFVANYCPLLFLDENGRNLTPDRIHSGDRQALTGPCDRHLAKTFIALGADWVVGIGKFAEKQAQRALRGMDVKVGGILHPSPASPAANRGWSEQALFQLKESGVW